ncbi:MAG TPA: DUF2752 domain-containing protein [Polyangia bacterium]|nr:DUF2752 domain-containing protein [Polyangia bacterium]
MPSISEQARGVHLALLILSLAPWLHLALTAAGALDAFANACPFPALTGEPCPLCGTSRAGLALLSCDLSGSLAHNPLGLGLIVAAVTQPPYRLLRTLRPAWSWREESIVDGLGLAWLAAVLILSPTIPPL